MTLLLFLILAVCLFNLGIVLWVIYEHFFNTDIPAAIGHTVKLRILHCLFLLMLTWAKICEKLGICSKLTFIRFVLLSLPVKEDPKLVVKNLCFGTVPVRLYQPKARSASLRKGIIFIHGGGMLIGSLDIYHSTCCFLARETNSVVLSISYRLAPEHRNPSGLNDCMAASVHFLRNLETYGVDPFYVTFCGDSAGGTMVASICQTLVTKPDLPKIRAQILIYPFMQAINLQLPSHQRYKNTLFLNQKIFLFCVFQYFDIDILWKTALLNGAHLPLEMRDKCEERVGVHNIPERFKQEGYQPKSPGPFDENVYLETSQIFWAMNSPLFADKDIIARLPETLLVSCEFDVLRDDSLLYKKILDDQGVPVSWHHIEDGFHGVLFTFDKGFFIFPCALTILNIMVDFIKDL
ncbi:arylacetamide deacetylase-like 4 [Monodelphis domestica]|uniref:arylacetamide deacetylase-like 4 n=1 Tax=Monodelphis domestica TaxID=13616 RepID=UPI0024E24BD0|nr:arylacetamide deacetylase-like 4 [Monodelphis domestica]